MSLRRKRRKKTPYAKMLKEEKRLEKLEKELHYKAICEKVNERDSGCCVLCGAPYPERHHIKFRSQGGMDDMENLVSLCKLHHVGDNGPHKSNKWRRYWESWASELYPLYWKGDEGEE